MWMRLLRFLFFFFFLGKGRRDCFLLTPCELVEIVVWISGIIFQ